MHRQCQPPLNDRQGQHRGLHEIHDWSAVVHARAKRPARQKESIATCWDPWRLRGSAHDSVCQAAVFLPKRRVILALTISIGLLQQNGLMFLISQSVKMI